MNNEADTVIKAAARFPRCLLRLVLCRPSKSMRIHAAVIRLSEKGVSPHNPEYAQRLRWELFCQSAIGQSMACYFRTRKAIGTRVMLTVTSSIGK